MKIESPNLNSIKNIDKKKSATKSGSNFKIDVDTEEQKVSNLKSISQINSLFMLQEVTEDTSELTEKSKKNGEKILSALEDLKLGLLSGQYAKDNLYNLVNLTKQQIAANIDPNLKNILKEIETRAAVELAKLDNIK